MYSGLDSGVPINTPQEKDPCENVAAVDKANADKPGMIDYDTDIGSDIEMNIPTDPEERLCMGIRDSAALLGAESGPELMDMLSKLARLLLSKSVLNEETLIEILT